MDHHIILRQLLRGRDDESVSFRKERIDDREDRRKAVRASLVEDDDRAGAHFGQDTSDGRSRIRAPAIATSGFPRNELQATAPERAMQARGLVPDRWTEVGRLDLGSPQALDASVYFPLREKSRPAPKAFPRMRATVVRDRVAVALEIGGRG